MNHLHIVSRILFLQSASSYAVLHKLDKSKSHTSTHLLFLVLSTLIVLLLRSPGLLSPDTTWTSTTER